MQQWVDLAGHGMQLRMAVDRGRAEWCVVPAAGFAPEALDVYAGGLLAMGFLGDRPGLFHHPVLFDRRRQPRNPPTAASFRANGFPMAAEVPFDRRLHVLEIRPAQRVDRDPALDAMLAAAQDHAEGEAGTLRRLVDAAVDYGRRHGLDVEAAFRDGIEDPVAPAGP